MVGFQTKKITTPLRLGEQLKQAREQRQLSLEEAARATGIATKYLAAIEASSYKSLPGEVYTRCFLKVYASFVGLDVPACLKTYRSERTLYKKTQVVAEDDFSKPLKKVSKVYLVVTPRLLRTATVGLLALLVLGYLGVKAQAIITPPALLVESPANNVIISQSFIDVSGQVEKESTLQINGQQVVADEDGYFNKTIGLQTGTNFIEIKAEKRHGTETKIYRQVVVVDEDSSDTVTN